MNNFFFFLGLVTNACENIAILRVCYFIKSLLKIAFIIIPIALIVMVSLDFAQNVISNDENMKKNFQIALKRLIYTIALFFVPTIVSFVINTLGDFNVNYLKCLNVTPSSIEKQITANKNKCTGSGYKWDSETNECLIEALVSDRGSVEISEKIKVKNSSSNSGTSSGNFAKYFQCDYGKTMCGYGCGPTSLAIIANQFSGQKVTPPQMYEYLQSIGYNTKPNGLSHSAPTSKKLLKKYNLKVETIINYNDSHVYDGKKANDIKKAVDSGKGIVLLIQGHYVVIGPNTKCKKNEVHLYEVGSRTKTGCYTMKDLWVATKHHDVKAWRMAWAYSSNKKGD